MQKKYLEDYPAGEYLRRDPSHFVFRNLIMSEAIDSHKIVQNSENLGIAMLIILTGTNEVCQVDGVLPSKKSSDILFRQIVLKVQFRKVIDSLLGS